MPLRDGQDEALGEGLALRERVAQPLPLGLPLRLGDRLALRVREEHPEVLGLRVVLTVAEGVRAMLPSVVVRGLGLRV
jgi:hypothetical protein